MAKKSKKTIIVHTHSRRVKPSSKNPSGVPNLKNNLFFILFLSLGCAMKAPFEISSYHIEKSQEDLHVVTVSSNHIKQECLFLNAEEENRWRHQYVMYVLNSQKEVIEVLHSVNQDKSGCLSQVKEVSKVLKQTSVVNLCLRGQLKKDLTNSAVHEFNKLEKYPVRYSFLTFDSICASNECYSVNDVWTETCPGFKKH